MQTEELYKIFLQNPQVETDTRKLEKGSIFFALKGPNYNGNHYCMQALEAGASFCISDEITEYKSEKILHVADSLQSLQQLAKKHRQQSNIPFIAITGSNGKTTTKELVHQVLATQFKSYTTVGNLNNHIGIPLTILSVKKDAEIAIIEMGANHQKEIEDYCKYAMPTHGIITNIGKAHLEGFGGEEGVKKGKGELFDYLRKTGGTAFVNYDYDYLKELGTGISAIITYGTQNADYTGHIENDGKFLEVVITKGASLPTIKTHLVGGYNLPNILTAVCVGKTFGIKDENIRSALEKYMPSNSRSQLIEKGSNKIILDAYNANPTSMKAAIENFAKMHGEKKILIVGAMMELGTASEAEHTSLINLIAKYKWYKVVVTGEPYKNLPIDFLHFADVKETADWYRNQHFKNAQVLIKGSRSMQMEKVIE